MASAEFSKYGQVWSSDVSPFELESYMIKGGVNLFTHYRELHSILWPNDEHNKWSDLALKEFTDCIEFRKRGMIGLLGPGSSGKTYYASKFAISHYFIYPHETTVLLTTTTRDKLNLGILGEVKKLHKQAKELHPELPGIAIDYKQSIITDRSEEGSRDFRNGVVGIACYKGEHWVGIGPFVGIKNKWVFLVADECALMDISYLRATANLDKNERFIFIPIANPVNGEHSPMGQACEPELGWASVRDIEKTTVWPTKYAKGRCINFVGTDSPNFDGDGKHWPFLIDQERIDSTLKFYGPHSEEYNAMCLGVMRAGEDSRRVLTKQLCTIHHAFDKAVWKGTKRTKIYAVDAAYGGDRCVGGWIEFGEDQDGRQIVRVDTPHVIRVGVKRGKEPEDEIAEQVQSDCELEGIPIENIFYDSTGRGTLGAAFARVFGSIIPVPVEFGGRPSTRAVRLDLFIMDPQTGQRRHKRCDEEYMKRVSEFWFAVRWLVESEQMRELPESVATEYYMREWIYVGGNKRDVEPKEKTKQRIGRSPDEADWLCTAVEGARQRGLQIQKLGGDKFTEAGPSWLSELNARHQKLMQSMRLKTAA